MPDLPPVVDLAQAVLKLVAQIPPGSVSTFGDLAHALGDEQARSARWIGGLLKEQGADRGVPCHRVVRATGVIGDPGDPTTAVKAKRLRQEGAVILSDQRADLSHRFLSFETDQPLARLKAFQQQWGAQVRQSALPRVPKTFAGVDVAYRADGRACGAYVLLDAKSLAVIEQRTLLAPAPFPYVPGFLTWRELPVILELCRQARNEGLLGDVVFCDGNGRLHPWRAGIATCLGVLLDHPVIGVGKSLLCGRVEGQGEPTEEGALVRDGSDVIGLAVGSHTSRKPVYVSVGNRITLAQAGKLARQTLCGRRLPAPIHLADRLTKLAKDRSE